MSEGFKKENLNITLNLDAIDEVLKEYKKIKKYQKSNLYAIRTMDGTEKIVSKLIEEGTN
jgi:hypothetical protein